MGEHLVNPNAIAKAAGQNPQRVAYIDLGDNFAVIGVALQPAIDEEGNFCITLVAHGGKRSDLMPMKPVSIVLGEVAKLPLNDLKANLAAALGETWEPAAEPAQ